jgi:hypothetical protein
MRGRSADSKPPATTKAPLPKCEVKVCCVGRIDNVSIEAGGLIGATASPADLDKLVIECVREILPLIAEDAQVSLIRGLQGMGYEFSK